MAQLEEKPAPPIPNGRSVGSSRLGIASCALAMVSVLLFCFTFLGINWLVDAGPQGMNLDRASFRTLLYSVTNLGYCGPVLNLVGIGLGIGSLIQKNAKKSFGITGIILNIVFLCIVAGLLILGG